MATIQAFKDLLTQSVTLREMERDQLGNVSVKSQQANVPAHIEYQRRQTFTRAGEKVIARATIFFDDGIVMDWTDNDNEWEVVGLGLTFKIVSAEAIYDPRDGLLHHWEMLSL